MSKWDAFDGAVRRLHDDFAFRELQVTTFSRSLDENNRAEWTATDAGTVAGEVTRPDDPTRTVAAGGEDRSVDVEIWVRDDTDLTITPMGAEDARATELTAPDGATYAAIATFDEGNGLIRIDAIEQ